MINSFALQVINSFVMLQDIILLIMKKTMWFWQLIAV